MTKTKLPARPKRLFAVPSEYRVKIYQPNNITNSIYSFTLIQERIFNYIVYYLQTYIKKVMDGAKVSQLDLFQEQPDREYIDIDLPMYLIAKPYQYNEVRLRAIDMVNTLIKIDQKDRTGKKESIIQGVLTHVREKEEGKRSAILHLRMSKAVAVTMLNIDHDNWTPVNYTSFMLDVALSMGNKYSPRIYKLLSSWKNRGMYRTTPDELRQFLQLENKYKTYETLKRCILLPVQAELKDKADIYFELSETREHNKVVKINFVIKDQKGSPNAGYGTTDDNINYRAKQWWKIETQLRNVFKVDDKGIGLVLQLVDRVDPAEVYNKMMDAFNWMNRPEVISNPNKRITNPGHYVVRTILREFPVQE